MKNSMKKSTLNIWKSYNFKEKSGKSAFDYLNEQKDELAAKSKGLLTMGVECYSGNEMQFVCKLYITAPNFGNYRREILQVIECIERFPVTVIDYNGKKIVDVQEKHFLKIVGEIISSPLVKKSIETLYQQSRGNVK